MDNSSANVGDCLSEPLNLQSVSQEVRKEQVRLLFKPSLNAGLTAFIAAFFLAYIQWPVIDHTIIRIWLVSISFVTIARIAAHIIFFRTDPNFDEVTFWEKISNLIMIFSALSWGAAGIFLFPEGDFERQAGTIVFLAGMSAGAVTTLSALRVPVLVFLLFTMLPLTAHLFAESTPLTTSLAIMCLVYTAFLFSSANRIYETYLQNITLRIKSRNEEEAIRKSEETVLKTAEILELIATGESAENIYDAIAHLYEARHSGLRCSMLILKGNKLLHGGAPSLPKSYRQAVHGLKNGSNVGSCGTSTYTGKRVLVEDIATDPKWSALKGIALSHGLRSCWSEPIKDSAGNVLGAFGMYYNHPALPTKEELVDLESAARLAGIVMQRELREEQIHQKNKMEAVGYLAGGMAHNFNNNLSIILGNIELAELKQPVNNDVVSLLGNAKIAVSRSRDLIRQIITYSRKGVQHKVATRLQAVVDETVVLLRSTLPTTVKLQQVSSSGSDSVYINADASQIQEVLINLCNNAVHAMDERGELSILLDIVDLKQGDSHTQPPGRYIKLSVKDTGCGMPIEVLDKIFDPFYSTKEEYEGAGMGLSTVQGIVAQHGGVIIVDSTLGQGTTFKLYFSALTCDHVKEEIPKDVTLPKGVEHILFVDDDEMLASLGGELLTEVGYRVTTMTDSTEALQLFEANADSFDLVITDQTMPELCGKDLIQKMLQISPNLPTILCSGYSHVVDDETIKELGIDAFLMKPIDLPDLVQAIRGVLDKGEK